MLKCIQIALNLLLINCSLCHAKMRGCSVSFPKYNDLLQPLILTNKSSYYNFTIPEEKNINIRTGESIVLFCSGSFMKNSSTNLTAASCTEADVFNVFGNYHKFEDLSCTDPVRGKTSRTNVKCGNNQGHIINIGYQITKKHWLTLFKVCYDSVNGNSLYAEHTLYGKEIGAISKQSQRPRFQSNSVPYNIRPDTLYKQRSQKDTLSKLLGSSALVDSYISKNSYLARGHLAPDADFIFTGMQFNTYYYINACPQWQQVNAGNWLEIEKITRNVATKYKQPLTVITGQYGVLSLPDINNNPIEISLSTNGNIRVPKFLWKVIYLNSTKAAIVLLILNNPFITTIFRDDILCDNICKNYGWDRDRWMNVKKGFVFCCDVRDLQQVIPEIPKLTIRQILRA